MQRLGESLKLLYGKPLPEKDRDPDGKYPVYGANGVKCRTNLHYCDKPGIIIGRKGSAGEVTLTEPRFWPLDVTYFVDFEEGRYDLRFLYYQLNLLDLPSLAKGVKPGINRNDVYEIKAALPPLPEQKRIVAILDEAFEGIGAAVAHAERNLANARELFESHLNAVFTRKGEGWVERNLGDLVWIKHGYAFKSQYFAERGEYVLLTPGNFYEEGGYRDRGDKQKYYTGEIPDGFVLAKNAFLVAMTEQAAGLLGSPLIVPEGNRFLHNQRLGLLEVKEGVPWCNEFFYHVFNTKRFRQRIHDDASGVKVRHTSPGKLCSVAVTFPCSGDEQRMIADELDEVLDSTRTLESIYRQKLAALTELKQSILRKAFAGELTAEVAEQVEAA